MTLRKLDDEKILKAYEKWNDRKENVDELCKRLGISKQSLYLVLRRNDVVPKNRRGEGGPGSTAEQLGRLEEKLDRVLVAVGAEPGASTTAVVPEPKTRQAQPPAAKRTKRTPRKVAS